MIIYDLYYKALKNGNPTIQIESFNSLEHLSRDFHNRIKHLDCFIDLIGYEERNIAIKPVPDHKPSYKILFNNF